MMYLLTYHLGQEEQKKDNLNDKYSSSLKENNT